MIALTRLNGDPFVLNAGYIERLETTPDTVVTMFNGDKYVVRESIDNVVELVRRWQHQVLTTPDIVRAGDEPTTNQPDLHLVPRERGDR